MGETYKLAAILVSDVFGYPRLADADEDRTLASIRTLRGDLIERTNHRIVKRPGDGSIIEFLNVIEAVNRGLEVQGRAPIRPTRRQATVRDSWREFLSPICKEAQA